LRGVHIDEIPVIKNQLLIVWVEMFYACHNHGFTGLTQWCWPNGKSYLEQPCYLVQVFNLIQQQIAIVLKQQTRSGK
jgi:hypothetical protein